MPVINELHRWGKSQQYISILQLTIYVTFSAVEYHSPPPKSQLAFHIYYVKYENTLTCKRISWDSGGGDDVLKIVFYFLYVYIRTFMEIGNQTQNHKIETNSELIYENGSI